MPTTVSTALVPRKKAATWPAGTAWPVTGANAPASMAAPAPTEAGANGRRRPPVWAPTTSRTAAGVAGSPNAARKQPSAASRQMRLRSCHGSTPRA